MAYYATQTNVAPLWLLSLLATFSWSRM